MKKFLSLVLLLTSLNALAMWPEVECEGRTADQLIQMEVEEGFPRGSSFRRAELSVTKDGARDVTNFTVNARPLRMGRVDYSAAGVRLSVDFWPDQIPQWGRSYRGTLVSSVLENKQISMWCRFPNIH